MKCAPRTQSKAKEDTHGSCAPEGPAVKAGPQHDGLAALLCADQADRAQQLPVAPQRHQVVPGVRRRCCWSTVILHVSLCRKL